MALSTTLSSHKTLDRVITEHDNISGWHPVIVFHISRHANSTENTLASGSSGALPTTGAPRDTSLSQDTQRVKTHMAISPYYHRQLILFKGTHFACRHRILGGVTRRGVRRTEHEWPEGFGSAGHKGNARARAARCLPRPGHSPRVTSSSRRGKEHLTLSPHTSVLPAPLRHVNEAIPVAGLRGERLSKCPRASARPGFHSYFSE